MDFEVYFNLSFHYQWGYCALFIRLLTVLCTMWWVHLVSLIRVECSLFCYKMFMSCWHVCLRCTPFDHNKNRYLLILSYCEFCLSLVTLLCFNKFGLCIMTVSSFNYSALVLTRILCSVGGLDSMTLMGHFEWLDLNS